jgi:phosphopentomutase
VYSKKFKAGKEMPIMKTFADVGYTLTDIFKTEKTKNGSSFLKYLE